MKEALILQCMMALYLVLMMLLTGLCFHQWPQKKMYDISLWISFTVTFVLAAELIARAAYQVTTLSLPDWIFPLWAMVLAVQLVVCGYQKRRSRQQQVSAGSVRQALDNLEDGLCFADESGNVVLTNRTMLQLAGELTGTYLRSAAQFWNQLTSGMLNEQGRVQFLASPAFRFTDGRIFRFTRTELEDETGKHYTELRAADITVLYRRTEELTRENRQLRNLHDQLVETTRDIARICNEDELLSSKLRVHDRLGELLITTCTAITNEDTSRGNELVTQWKEIASGFRTNLLSDRQEENPVTAVGNLADKLGFTITYTGEPLWEGEVLAFALREAMYNAMNHADAEGMTVHAEAGEKLWKVTIWDNGRKAKGPIMEGGGLTNLRQRLLRAGGRLEIEDTDGVVLKMYLPEGV